MCVCVYIYIYRERERERERAYWDHEYVLIIMKFCDRKNYLLPFELPFDYHISPSTTKFTLQSHQTIILLSKPLFRQSRSLSRTINSSRARKVGCWRGYIVIE